MKEIAMIEAITRIGISIQWWEHPADTRIAELSDINYLEKFFKGKFTIFGDQGHFVIISPIITDGCEHIKRFYFRCDDDRSISKYHPNDLTSQEIKDLVMAMKDTSQIQQIAEILDIPQTLVCQILKGHSGWNGGLSMI